MDTNKKINRIVVVGPESTGKSTLCTQLAAHYGTVWVREFAREYLEVNGMDYKFEDLYNIAAGQTVGEETAIEKFTAGSPPLLFIDTDLYVIKIWSEFVFNKCNNRILTAISKRKADLYLLCDIDLPWIADELREYPDITVRQKLFQYYKEEMIEQPVPWIIIRGAPAQRLQAAIHAVDQLLRISE